MKIESLEPHHIRMFHEMALQEFSGVPGENEPGMIEYVAVQPFLEIPFKEPREERYPGLFLKAAVYMHSLATHQYFVDGNKRTAYISAASFLELNGYLLLVSDEDLYYASKLVANKKWSLKRLEEWLQDNSISDEEYTEGMEGNRYLIIALHKEYVIMMKELGLEESLNEDEIKTLQKLEKDREIFEDLLERAKKNSLHNNRD
ncbi:hypothetical protein COD81_28985 [Bacillus cereus]|uniref:type II toxin-antitoxin system death-on-curing family toxin n=1 Tax=Bacillus cereus TaxID=1396 RepID=UPI000BF44104|nr:Fic family protein [Bacillus cereus]PFL73140.1 hypothetical protein COJ32_28775 [Bacillus cereus]PGV02014.1 hypothetical protein COD81_28985 [Bacillus cereus]